MKKKFELDLYRISKVTMVYNLKKIINIIKAKTITDMNDKHYTLNQIEFKTDKFFINDIIYSKRGFQLNVKSSIINFHLLIGALESRYFIDCIYLKKVLNEFLLFLKLK